MRLAIIEQQADAPAGLVGEWAAARSHAVDPVRGPDQASWPDPVGWDAVIALGSERSVHASPDPWVGAQVDFLRRAHAADVPVLGICFGGQALAAALGGTVAPSPRTEIGWTEVAGDDGFSGRWFSWHVDAFTVPPGAAQRARSDVCPQAFEAGRSVGLQFHPEVTAAIVDDWLEGGRDAVPDPRPIRAETAREMPAARKRAFALFDRVAARWRG